MAAPLDGGTGLIAAGTRQPLWHTSVPVKWLVVFAVPTNTGVIRIGGQGVCAVAGSEAGTPLYARTSTSGDAWFWNEACDLRDIYIDGTVTGDRVAWQARQ